MSWLIRFGIFALVLGLAYNMSPCFGQDYVIDIVESPDYDYYSIELKNQGCSSDPFIFVPSIPGTCYANSLNCTAAGGFVLVYVSTFKCAGSDVCCYIAQNTTLPTMPTLPPAPTMPTFPGLPNCTTPAPLDPSNPQNSLQPLNCTVPSIPSITG